MRNEIWQSMFYRFASNMIRLYSFHRELGRIHLSRFMMIISILMSGECLDDDMSFQGI